ncbi:hypothetical protein [Nonomuraea sp. NPDC002799]
MSQWSFSIEHRTQPGAVTFDELGNKLWLATETGDLVTFRLYNRAAQVLGGGYLEPVAVLPQRDGLKVVVVERAGTVLSAARAAAGRRDARVVADLGRTITTAVYLPDAGRVLAAGDSVAVTVDLTDGSVTTLTSGLVKPQAVVVDEQRRRAVVLDETPEGTRLRLLDLDSGALTERAGEPLDGAAAMTTALAGVDGVFVATEPGGALTLVRLEANAEEPGPDLGGPVRGLARWGSLVLLVTDTDIVAHEWGLQPGPLEMFTPIGPVFTGGYFRAVADLDGQGLTPADVEFSVEEGIEAGFVSAGIEPPEPDGGWPIVVGAGHRPGEYHLIARRVATGEELARHRFRITGYWPDDKRGPTVVVTGEAPVAVPLAWGGTWQHQPEGIGAPKEWGVAVVLVNTLDQRFTDTTAQAAKSAYTSHLILGDKSARGYYDEVSFGKTTVSLVGDEVFGPIDAPYYPFGIRREWGTVFYPMGGRWGGWRPFLQFWDECGDAFSAYLHERAIEDGDPGWAERILQAAKTIVFVFPTSEAPATDEDPARFVWGEAMLEYPPRVWWMDSTRHGVSKPGIMMPAKLPDQFPNVATKDLAEVLTHELGHAAGLRDLYKQEYTAEIIAGREMTGFDMMGTNTFKWPHFSLAHRRRMKWIDSSWIRRFDFDANPIGGTVTLHAMESLSADWRPEDGHCAGIEVPIRGRDFYYFEYRSRQPGQVGDQLLDDYGRGVNHVVLGTHINFDPAFTPERPHILLLPPDVDRDGPFLITAGEDYKETDTDGVPSNDSAYNFRLVLDENPGGDTVQVSVHYDPVQVPQLRIEPTRGHDGEWKSPDINVIGPFGRNFVTAGRDHTIEVIVRNVGNLAAKEVKIRVAWLPFTTTPGSWTPLPDPPPLDIPAKGAVVYNVPWRVPKSPSLNGVPVWHFCVRADITAYVVDHPSHNEVTVKDNWSQSNFNRVYTPFGSPSARSRTGVAITNTSAHSAAFRTAVNQNSALFRTYLGNTWLRLEPGETHVTELMYESLAGDAVHGSAFMDAFHENEGLSNDVGLTTSMIGPGDSCGVAHQWCGAQLNIVAGYLTRIESLRMTSDGVFGKVIGERDNDAEVLNYGEVNVVFWLADQEETTVAASWYGDQFGVNPPNHIQEAAWAGEEVYAEAFYASAAVWASCRSSTYRLVMEN